MHVPRAALGGRTPLFAVLAGFTLLHVAALGLFARGFLLTRVELTTRSSCGDAAVQDTVSRTSREAGCNCGDSNAAAHADAGSNDGQCRQVGCRHDEQSAGCWGERHFSKTAWVIVDALRFDFVACEGAQAAGAGCQSRMPQLLDLAHSLGPAAQMYRFVADPPTTTMQRLRGILTGGLPTFVDVGASFSAAAVAEDNLIDQLVAAGQRLAFVGDDTWMQLFPHQFGDAAPFPSFNVQDLHTVDNGVWEFLVPALRNASGWDVLVGHYLGVDHAGHTDDVFAPTMAAKLAQMDSQLAQIVDEVAALAGPGGPHADTLLLVWGDHGQTDSGDHGGGSPPEVDSVLVAVDAAALHAQRHGSGGSGGAAPQREAREAAGAAGGSGGGGPSVPPGRSKAQAQPAPSVWPTMPQVDFAPTLAALLGMPTPYASIGRVSRGLWHLRGCSGGVDALSCRQQYAATLQANAWQVQRYLQDYAASDGGHLPTADLAHSQKLYAAAAAAGEANAGSDEHVSRLDTYLEAAADLARRQWTQFGVASMGGGLALLAATLAAQLAACWALMRSPLCRPSEGVAPAAVVTGKAAGSSTAAAAQGSGAATGRRAVDPAISGAAPQSVWQWGVEGAAWLAVLGHAAALLSNSFILAQGRMLAFLLAALAALLGRSTVSLLLRCQRAERQLAAARAASSDTQRQAPASSDALASGQGADAAALQGGAASQGGVTRQPAAAPGQWRGRVREAALLTLLLLAANWALASQGLVRRSGRDAMWRTAAEHHTLLVPDAAAAPAAAAATRQPVASPADSSANALQPAAPMALGGLGAAAQLSQRLLGKDATLRLQELWPAVAAAAAAAWSLCSTYGALLLLPALVTRLASSDPKTCLDPVSMAPRPRRWRSMRAVAGAYAAPQRGGFGVQSLKSLQQTALWAAFVFVTLHWLWEDAHWLLDTSRAGSGGGSGSGVCPSEAATLGDAWGLARRWAGHMFTGVAGSHPDVQPGALAGAWQLLLAWLGFLLPSFRAGRALWSVLAAGLGTAAAGTGVALRLLSGPAAAAISVRLRLMLPRAAYCCAVAAAALSVAHAGAASARHSTGLFGNSSGSGDGGGSGAAAADGQQPTLQLDSLQQRRRVAAAGACAAGLAAAVAAPLALVLGRRGPLPLLLAAVQAAALLRLLSLRAKAQRQLDGSPTSAAPVGSLLWALFSLQLFFCTGHFCEFAGLQYTAGFAGVEDFDFYQSGALLALNTFGSFLMAGLALPLVCLPAPWQQGAGAGAESSLATTGYEMAHQSPAHPSDARYRQPPGQPQSGTPSAAWPYRAPADGPESQFQSDLRVASVVFLTVMTLNAAVATASAAIQRRHLMVWALFAPKFLFDACILLVCDAAVFVGVAVALLVPRRH